MLNSRCWVRAEAGRQLEAALKDCDEALRLRPDSPAALDSRGLVQLRLGAHALSLADYDRALALRRTQVTSWFGRGLAELKLGRKAAAEADLAAARGLDPEVDATFAGWGVKP